MSQKIEKTSISEESAKYHASLQFTLSDGNFEPCRLCIAEFTNGDVSCSRMNADFAIFGLLDAFVYGVRLDKNYCSRCMHGQASSLFRSRILFFLQRIVSVPILTEICLILS